MNSAGSTASALADEVTPEQLLTMPDSQSMELIDDVIVEKSVSEESSQIELWIAAL